MKKTTIVLLVLIISIKCLLAQTPGEWTWVNGVSTKDYVGHYGTMGVPDSLNKPTGLYEAAEWTDNQGDFWLYGGVSMTKDSLYRYSDDMWRYNVATNRWTWVRGSGGLRDQKPRYGTQGVASPLNTPGERSMSPSWTDDNGDLWLFGGFSYVMIGTLGPYNDLWKYNISTNMWTWMKGDTVPEPPSNPTGHGYYGIKGVENVNNKPPCLTEVNISWLHNDHLWMLDNKGCMWKYRISTNNWTWVNGDTTGLKVFGQKGIPDSSNTPGKITFAYTRWKDSYNNFWFLYTGVSDDYRSILKYDVNQNMWTWMWGDTLYSNPVSSYGDSVCNFSSIENDVVIPFSRVEARACWIDCCDNLWLMGGNGNDHSTYGDLNDLIYFDIHLLKWFWVGNDTIHNYNSIHGTIGVSSPLNKPAARAGALPFKDLNGNLWLYGGLSNDELLGDLWKFELDSGCSVCKDPMSINQNEISSSYFKVYPNPSNGIFTVEKTLAIKEYTLEIYDSYGILLYKSTINNNTYQLDLSEYPPGIYLLKGFTDNVNQTYSIKLIIK